MSITLTIPGRGFDPEYDLEALVRTDGMPAKGRPLVRANANGDISPRGWNRDMGAGDALLESVDLYYAGQRKQVIGAGQVREALRHWLSVAGSGTALDWARCY